MKWTLGFCLLLATSVAGADYYVAKNGFDTNPGTEGSPFLTIQKGVTVAFPGDTVFVGAGTYSENTRTSSRGGTAGAPIIFDGQNVATNGSWSLEFPYIHIKNFTVTGGTNLWLGQLYMERAAFGCVVSNNVFNPNLDTALSPLVRWNGPSASPYGTAASSNLFVGNTFKNARAEMVFRVYGDYNTIYRNRMLDCDATDFIQVFGRTNYIVGNWVENIYESGLFNNHTDFVQTFGIVFGSKGHIVDSNYVFGMHGVAQLGNLTEDGITNGAPGDTEVTDMTFRNNVFIGVSAKISCAIPNLHFYNNTFIRCSTNSQNGGDVLIFPNSGSTGQGHGGRVYNNVFLDCGLSFTNSGYYSFHSTLTNVSADYNYIGKLGRYAAVQVDAMQRPVGNPGGWLSWWEDHGINGGNPYLINETRNLRPFIGSPLINAGTNLSGSFTTDLDGKTRDALFDIGAYEYAEVPPATLACITEPKAPRAFPIAHTNAIAIVWPTNQYRLLSKIARRAYTNNPIYWSSWTSIHTNTTNPTREASYLDTNISSGIHYEYELAQLMTNWVCDGLTNGPAWSYQYLSTGTDVPLKDVRGNLMLLVESGVAASLTSELANLTNDFIGDGYKVFRHDVASVEVTNAGWFTAVTNTRALVQADYLTDTNSDWTLFIVGHVPIPYGGDISPGSHTENLGAHPADWFYADRNAANYHDVAVNDITADDPPQWNIPGDGKFDTNFVPNMPQMRLGRIDLNQYPQTGKTSAQLLSQYLNRNHQWRHKQFTVPEISTINFSNSAPPEGHGLLSSFYGSPSANVVLTNWVLYLTNNAALFAYSTGTGSYYHDNTLNVPTGAGYTTNILKNPFYGVFVQTFGSYYGDWDTGMKSNLFLPVFLANSGYALTTEYRENTMTMASTSMGEPIGQQMFAMAANFFPAASARYFQVNGINLVFERVHPYCSLLGDPTLKVRQVAPPTNVVVTTNGSDSIVTWTAASDSNIQGYHVYRSSSDLNAFTRLTTTTTTSPYTNSGVLGGTYMVRTVKLEESDSRSYYHASQGVFNFGPDDPEPPDPEPPASSAGLILKNVTLKGNVILR